ncbi:MAG: hypothetical protein LUC60_09755 [Lachnospiraceae bacterium]|nr:hypothetical protein [Lachnospiraceae bacterium]
MKRHNTLTDGEQLLARVLEECLEEDLSFVPPEREIERKHSFSQEFEEAMSELLEEETEEEVDEEEEAIRRQFRHRFVDMAAVILVFFICGAVAMSLPDSFFSTSISSDTAAEETAEETEEATSAEAWDMEDTAEEAASAEVGDMEESAEETSGTDVGEENDETVAEPSEVTGSTAEYGGELIDEAAEQELASSLDGLTLGLAYPVAEFGDATVGYSLQNSGEETVSYFSLLDLEVYLDGVWYTVPYPGEEKGHWIELGSGIVLDGALDLSAWALDGEAHLYRLALRLADGRIAAEFTFEKAVLE